MVASSLMTTLSDRLSKKLDLVGIDCSTGVPLSQHTTFRIGGPADVFITVSDSSTLISALEAAAGFPVFIIGGGSNLLVRDAGIEGLVIKNASRGITVQDGLLSAASGENLAELVKRMAEQGIGGLEFLAGIPGTLGGAVCGNAGAYGCDISQRLHSVTVWRNGEIKELPPDELDFSYRSSSLKRAALDAVVLDVKLLIDPSPACDPLAELRRILEQRAGRLPPAGTACAGSYFKNLPPKQPGEKRRAAGRLLELAGAGKVSVNDAAVFEGHANIIVNKGRARADDVLELADRLRRLVYSKFSVNLEAEVMTVGREC